jgi:membrane-associated phospholipid phosphatase
MQRRGFLALTLAGLTAPAMPSFAATTDARGVLLNWYKLVLELVRHTATYSPPVASRAFAYLGITAYEVLAAGAQGYRSLAGQVNGLPPPPPRPKGVEDAAALNAALNDAIRNFFGNTGPTGQRAIDAMARNMGAVDGVSAAYGRAVADHILAWSKGDGGAVVENMGFPLEYTLGGKPSSWVPTSAIRQQQAPLLPHWGQNRSFAAPSGSACGIADHPPYSEDPASAFYAEAMVVYDTSKTLTDAQKTIARFWSDDPMLSPTPPGHWISIVLQIAGRDGMDALRTADILARLGAGLADSFIGCWWAKYEYDLIRPVTYIRRVIDPKWEPLLITPPFPEYPSGHSTQSGAAAAVLTAFFGPGFAFSDATHVDDAIPARSYPDFWTAAEEAAASRLYGGIHFPSANKNGLAQGKCIGEFAARLETKP